MKKKNRTLLFGILGIIFCWVFFGIIFGIIGLIIGLKGIKSEIENKGKIYAGLILSILSIIFAIMMIAIGANNLTSDSEKSVDESQQIVSESNSVDSQDSENDGNSNTDNSGESENTPVEITEDEFKAQCQEFNYKDVLRNPEEYIGQKIKVTVKVSSVHTSNFTDYGKYYFAWSDDGSDFWFENKYGILDYRAEDDFKILEDDIIAVYGEISEPQETTSIIVNSEELFCIDMKYAELLDE